MPPSEGKMSLFEGGIPPSEGKKPSSEGVMPPPEGKMGALRKRHAPSWADSAALDSCALPETFFFLCARLADFRWEVLGRTSSMGYPVHDFE